jgi:PAS domain S-box-containing protein
MTGGNDDGAPHLTAPSNGRAAAVTHAADLEGLDPLLDPGLRTPTLLTNGEGQLQELLRVLPAAIYMTDADGRITFYNEAAAALWGCRPTLYSDQWCGSWRLFWPDGTPLPHDQCPMAMALKQGRPIRGMEAAAERPDGTRVHFMAFPSPLRDGNGRIIGAVNMLVDISERKRAEQISQQLASIVESSDDAIVSKDLNGIIATWNKGAERIFGYLAEEVVGKPITIIIPADRQGEEPLILDRIRRGERIDHYETVRQRKDGTLIHISLTISPVRNASGQIVGASKIARDITERKRAEEQIRILAREAEHRAKNVLATVQATVQLSNADTPDALKRAIAGRIQALANVHRLFVESRWAGAELSTIVQQEVAAYCQGGETRVRVSGPKLVLEPAVAQAIAVVLHELFTNAAKYGALSVPHGAVSVSWQYTEERLSLCWSERGGPPAAPPNRQGFGTRVIRGLLEGQLKGEVRCDWHGAGLDYQLTLPLSSPCR